MAAEAAVTSRTAHKAVATPSFMTAKEEKEHANKKQETIQQLQDRLRDCQLQYQETAWGCQFKFGEQRTNTEQFNRLYFQPQVPFLDEPEKQKIFRKEFIQDVAKLPEPRPIYTIADHLEADCLDAIGDRSSPQVTKHELVMFYTRRQAQLYHKKHKIIKRWANCCKTAELIDQVSDRFNKELGRLQIEQDSIASRLMRLQPDDWYCHDGSNQRPKPTSPGQDGEGDQMLYKEADLQTNDSALRLDDFEVYLRHKTYVDKVNRPAVKLMHALKWLHMEKRYDVWYDSRIMMSNYRNAHLDAKYRIMFKVSLEIKNKLTNELGPVDEKSITAYTDRYVYHIKEHIKNRQQQMLNTQKFDHFDPFLLYASRAELKIHLEKLAKEYKLNCTQVDLDNGQMFTYQFQTFFPGKFEEQVRRMTFDWEDTGPNADIQMIDRLTRTLGLSKDALLSEISKHAADQRTASLLNALNVGKTGQVDMTLKDLTENELNGDQFTRHNLLRKLRQIEFFSLEESQIKMRRADWLDYICWQPVVSVQVQRQNQLLSSQDNRVDHLLKAALEFADVNDSIIVNKIIEDAIKVHVQKIDDVQKKIATCQNIDMNMRGVDFHTDGTTMSLLQATNPAAARELAQKQYQAMTDAQQVTYSKISKVENLDQLPQNLTKAFYSLRVIKTRDVKIKLLEILNYFRAIQRILALDVREFLTREKAYGDKHHIIDPHFGTDANGQPILKNQTPAGPSEIFTTTVERSYEKGPIRGQYRGDNLVDFKSYKLKNSFDPQVLSTCPIVPKHHRTFGRPTVYEPQSTENVREKEPTTDYKRMQALLNMRDTIHVSLETNEVYVLNEYGQRIIYAEAMSDMAELEEELVKIGSFYINRYEYVIQNAEIMGLTQDNTRASSLVDRPQMALDLLEREFEFQKGKIRLLEMYMEVYEHTVDPLECLRVLQIIVDLCVQRPRLNTDASMYCESYMAETEALHEREQFFAEFLLMQKQVEREANKNTHAYIETKIRKMQEAVDQYWTLKKQREKERRIGSNEIIKEGQEAVKQDEKNIEHLLMQKIMKQEQQENLRKDQLEKIKQRHITEFANEQYTDFATVLGLPEVTLEQLYNRFDESEAIVIDALRESAFLVKMVEGYPLRLNQLQDEKPLMGSHLPDCNLTDFYMAFQTVSKINAALMQSFAQLEKETQPENGFAVACLEVQMMKKARIALKHQQKALAAGGINPDYAKGQELFEEDFLFGNVDNLYYQMKSLHAEVDPKKNLYSISNPLVASKLDTNSVLNFNFPRIKAKEVYEQLQRQGHENNIADYETQELLKMAKNSVARPNLSYFSTLDNNAEDSGMNDRDREMQVKVPSIMKMYCNFSEVLRLREELIRRMDECMVLARIYKHQATESAKNQKLFNSDQIPFNTNQINGDEFLNYVDQNEGSTLHFENLPFLEFDKTLAANLDFKSESCLKALFTDLGVEEMRAILHLQIAHQHLLTVCVRINQLLLDKPLKGLAELDLITQKNDANVITTPNSVINLKSIMGANADCTNSMKIREEKTRLKTQMTKNTTKEMWHEVLAKKSRGRTDLAKRFSTMLTKLQMNPVKLKPEYILRLLRSYRLQLCHEYCHQMCLTAQKDSMKIQVLETCNELRVRACLLPNKSQIFRLGKTPPESQENLSYEANQNLRKLREFQQDDSAEMSLQSILTGSVCSSNQTLFYIPSAEEICLIMDRTNQQPLKPERWETGQDTLQSIGAEIDRHIKSMVKMPKILPQPVYWLEGQKYGVRKVWLEKPQDFGSRDSFQVLIYCSQLLNIFDLEYTMLRNLSPSRQTQLLEDEVLASKPFWPKIDQEVQKLGELHINEHKKISLEELSKDSIENNAAFKVIKDLDHQKKAWNNLESDIDLIAKKLRQIETQCHGLAADKRNINYLNELMILQHQASYYTFLNGIEGQISSYLEREKEPSYESDEYFYKLLLVMDQLTNRNIHSINLIRSNGFYTQHAQIAPMCLNLEQTAEEDFQSFKLAHQTVIDERCLIPRQVTLIRQMFGSQGQQVVRQCQFGYLDMLRTAFYNMDDETRQHLGVRFNELDGEIDHYLIFKGLKEETETKQFIKSKDHYQETLQAAVEFLSFKLEAANLERVIMCWDTELTVLPRTTREYQYVYRRFQQQYLMAILHEHESLNDQYLNKHKKAGQVRTKAERDKELLDTKKTKQQIYYRTVNSVRASSIVIKNLLEVNLIKIGIQMVKSEHAALQTCFEVQGQPVHVHPSQQFASTPYSAVDQVPHLDVVTKVGFLQQFLTRLKNRCTEVVTLTSGPNLLFSMKDFNDCLQLLARQLIKYGEEELRSRCETQNLREHQYHHLIYIKQMEALYFRQKCEQLLQNIETLTNAKMLSQGNQMIYELDMGARELQTLKDHYYVMENNLRQEIKMEFTRQLTAQASDIKRKKEENQAFRNRISVDLTAHATEEIQWLESKFKVMNHRPMIAGKVTGPQTNTQADLENLQQIKHLTESIRKLKIVQQIKYDTMRLRLEKELADERQKFSQNQSLWEQLAEAEKREQIVQQELTITKNNQLHYERLIEKLYGQLDHLRKQKEFLQKSKTKDKRQITELNSKMQDLEILESLDINKILEELRLRDKKIVHLDKVDKTFNEHLDKIQANHDSQLDEMRKALAKERAAKLEAFEKLDAMRVEMKTLEGKDSIKNDLWKEKCKELYDICRELETDNESLKLNVKNLQEVIAQYKNADATSQTLQNSTSDQSGVLAPVTREAIILQRKKYSQKPMTASLEQGRMRRGLSSGKPMVHGGHRNMPGKLVESATNLDSLKISAEGYERGRQLNTLRNQTADSGVVGTRLYQQQQSQQTAANSSAANVNTIPGVRTSYGAAQLTTMNQKSGGNISSMPQIKGVHKHFTSGQVEETQDSGTLRGKRAQ